MPRLSTMATLGKRFSSTSFLLILAYVLQGLSLAVSNGMYHPAALAGIVISWLCVLLVSIFHRRRGGFESTSFDLRLVLWISVLTMLAAGWLQLPAMYVRDESFIGFYRSTHIMIVGIATAIAFAPRRKPFNWLPHALFVLCFAVFSQQYFGVIRAAPNPKIDVYTMLRDGSKSLLRGENPYRTKIEDPYAKTENLPWTRVTHLVYPPAVLLPATIARFFRYDVRYVSAIGTLTVGCTLFWLCRRKPIEAALLGILWLAHPRGTFVTEQAWIDSTALGLLAIALVCTSDLLSAFRGGALGLFISFKQYNPLMLPALLRWKNDRQSVLWGIGTVLAVTLPFIIWDPGAWYRQTVSFLLSSDFRADSLSISAWLYAQTGIEIGNTWTILLAFGCIAYGWSLPHAKRTSTLLLNSTQLYLTLFLWGRQAFCNYYYFTGGLLLMTCAMVLQESLPSERR